MKLARFGWGLGAGLLVAGCVPGQSGSVATGGSGVCSVASAPAGTQPANEPDFALYGYPEVELQMRFTPGQALDRQKDEMRVAVPGDLYTDPLDLELMEGET